jgi:hypothetical protein
MIFLAGFIIIAVNVSSILIGCVRPAPAIRRRCQPGKGGVGKLRGPAGVSAVLEWQGGGGEGHGFSYLLELHMTYLAGSHVLRSWPGIRLKALSYELRCKLQATSYELGAMNFEKQVTSYNIRSVICKILPAPADDSTVWYLDCSVIVQCRIVLHIDRIQLSQLICTG